VLAVGGAVVSDATTATSDAEIYDLATGSWSLTDPLPIARSRHSATLLEDGRVLVAGGRGSDGNSLASAVLYDPVAGVWTPTGSMLSARDNFSATRLLDGRVLVAGGVDASPQGPFILKTAEIYDPRTGSWSATGKMNIARFNHQATLLADGRVLVTGGGTSGTHVIATRSAEIYDPDTGAWTATGNMTIPRALHTAARLPDGTVLVAGGLTLPIAGPEKIGMPTASAEIYDPASGSWHATASMTTPRRAHRAVSLSNGDVLVAGGFDATGTLLASAEVYNAQSRL
jgi:N-acetylneuraminic acid mutarotase